MKALHIIYNLYIFNIYKFKLIYIYYVIVSFHLANVRMLGCKDKNSVYLMLCRYACYAQRQCTTLEKVEWFLT